MKKSLKKFITTAWLWLSLITPSFSQNTEKIISNTKNNLTQVLDYDTTKHNYYINRPAHLLSREILEKAMLFEINKIRADSWLQPLKLNSLLNQTAQKYAQYIYDNQWYDHFDKQHKSPKDRMKQNWYVWSLYLENLLSWGHTIKESIYSRMNSKDHKENILDKEIKEFWLGFYSTWNYRIKYNGIWVQDFWRPKEIK